MVDGEAASPDRNAAGAPRPGTSPLRDLLDSTGSAVAMYAALSRAFGPAAGNMLGQLIFWTGKGHDPDWVYKSADELWHEVGINYKEQQTARERLRAAGVVEERFDRPNNRIYFRVVEAALRRCLAGLDGVGPRDPMPASRGAGGRGAGSTDGPAQVIRPPAPASDKLGHARSGSSGRPGVRQTSARQTVSRHATVSNTPRVTNSNSAGDKQSLRRETEITSEITSSETTQIGLAQRGATKPLGAVGLAGGDADAESRSTSHPPPVTHPTGSESGDRLAEATPDPSPAELYAAYPRKKKPADAVRVIGKTIDALRRRGPPPAGFASWPHWLLVRVEKYAAYRATAVAADRDEKSFTPYPASWFNAGSYDEDDAEWVYAPTKFIVSPKGDRHVAPAGQPGVNVRSGRDGLRRAEYAPSADGIDFANA